MILFYRESAHGYGALGLGLIETCRQNGVKTNEYILTLLNNGSIATYIWLVSNRKPAARKDKVQLIDASEFWQKMRKSLDSRRKKLSDTHIECITKLFGEFVEASEDGKPATLPTAAPRQIGAGLSWPHRRADRPQLRRWSLACCVCRETHRCAP
jgi:hypothetical protein